MQLVDPLNAITQAIEGSVYAAGETLKGIFLGGYVHNWYTWQYVNAM